jgi:hypothetical protein
MSVAGTFWTWPDVRLGSGVRTKADIARNAECSKILNFLRGAYGARSGRHILAPGGGACSIGPRR